MFARATTIHAHPSFLDVGIVHVRDRVMPTLAEQDGCAGMSMLVDRDAGRCIVTSSWLDEDTLRASETEAQRMCDRVAEIFHATTEITRWEIAAVHRDHRSRRHAGVRVTWLRTRPDGLERLIDTYKLALMPELEDLGGFCSSTLLADRHSGRAVSSISFDDRAAMVAGRGADQAIWARAVNEAGAEILEVAEFDLVIANLNAPEMA